MGTSHLRRALPEVRLSTGMWGKGGKDALHQFGGLGQHQRQDASQTSVHNLGGPRLRTTSPLCDNGAARNPCSPWRKHAVTRRGAFCTGPSALFLITQSGEQPRNSNREDLFASREKGVQYYKSVEMARKTAQACAKPVRAKTSWKAVPLLT